MAEVGATGALNTRYIRGTGLVAREVDSALQYYLFDAHGDVLHRLDANGNMLKTYRYDAFGNEIDPEPLDTNPFRYCGEYFDREIGTYYLRARNYDPFTGRFTTEDSVRSMTIGLPDEREAVDPLSLNLYTYGRNNPVFFTDPTGHFNLGQIFGGSMAMFMGYAAMTAGLAAITVLTGGLALVIAAGTVVVGGGLLTYGAFETAEGITGYNSLKDLQGEDAYYNTMGALSIAAPTGTAYSAQAYQMYAPITTSVPAISIDSNKFTNYVFDEKKAPGKSAAFTNLGYSVNDSDYLISRYRAQAAYKYSVGDYTLGRADQWGQRINIEIVLGGTGRYSDRVSYIKSGWMVRPDGSISLNTPFSGYTR